MIGLIFLAVVGSYVALNISLISYLWKNFSKQTAAIFTLIILSLPVGDALVGRLILRNSCEIGNNIVINRVVPNINKVFLSGRVDQRSPNYYGYKIIEELGEFSGSYIPKGFTVITTPKKPVKLVRRATITNGSENAIVEKDMEPTAEYGLRVQNSKTSWLKVKRYSAVDRKLTQELGSFYWYSFRGGWVERLFSMGGSTYTSCGSYKELNQKRRELLHATLKPST